VRCETEYDSTPYTPIAARTSAIAPKRKNITPNIRNCQKLRCRRASMVETWNTGSAASARLIWSRTAAVTAAGSPDATRMVSPVFNVGSKV